jgi:hypothetical protein
MGWLLICSGQFKPLRMICCYWQCSGAKGLGTLGPELEHFTRAGGGLLRAPKRVTRHQATGRRTDEGSD